MTHQTQIQLADRALLELAPKYKKAEKEYKRLLDQILKIKQQKMIHTNEALRCGAKIYELSEYV